MYQLYAIFRRDPLDVTLAEAYLDFLPPERRSKALRYRKPIDRENCILSYLLLRHALKRSFGLQDPIIEVTEQGKPFLPEHRELHFNISHCPVGCVVGVSNVPIGVDIQDIRPFSRRMVECSCSRDELERVNRAAQPDAEFARIWAMKESYLKMTGSGIRGALTAVDTTQMEHRIEVFHRHDCYIAVTADHIS